MAEIDENIGLIGDWMPSSPSSRTYFAEMLGDDMSSKSILEPRSDTGTDRLFLETQDQMTAGDTDKNCSEQTIDQLTEASSFSEQKPSSRGGLIDRIAARAGFNAPRLNTESIIRCADFSLNPDIRSPYLTISPGFSPTTLLDSPVFLTNSWAASPTTGKFSFAPNGNGKSSTFTSEFSDKGKDSFFDDINTSFAFKPFLDSSPSFFLGATTKIVPAAPPLFHNVEASVHTDHSLQSRVVESVETHSQFGNSQTLNFSSSSTGVDNGGNTDGGDQMVFNNTVGGGAERSPPLDDQQDEDQRASGDSIAGAGSGGPSEDGYNWRKYGQKQVKGSEYPRSYYKCTHPNCLVKKKVERSHEGHITEIIYKGAHKHPKPPPSRRSGNGSSNALVEMHDVQEQYAPQSGTDGDSVWPNTQNGSAVGTNDWRHDNMEVTSSSSAAPEYGNHSAPLQVPNGSRPEQRDPLNISSTFSTEEEEEDRGTRGSVSLGYDGAGYESESKRRKIETYATEMSGATRAIREPRVVVQTTSEVDILDDGYRWRKYGQKVVKGNPNPRSYYKCTSAGCTVRKHVERASHDLKSVITTYEGKHNHDVPAARNSSHMNSNASNAVTAQAGSNVQTLLHRSDPSQLHNSMARFDRGSFGSFSLPGRQQLGPSPGFSFGMNQTGLGNVGMAGLGHGHGQAKMPVLPIHQYLSQQRQISDMSFMLPKGEPKMEPISEPGLNMTNGSSVYQQIMSRLPLGPHM